MSAQLKAAIKQARQLLAERAVEQSSPVDLTVCYYKETDGPSVDIHGAPVLPPPVLPNRIRFTVRLAVAHQNNSWNNSRGKRI